MKRTHEARSRPLLLRLHEMRRDIGPEVSEDEAMSLDQMLRSMLTYDPTERATAKDVIGSNWMKRWGLTALQKFMRTT